MNDLEEVKFGVMHGAIAVKKNKDIRTALASEARYKKFTEAIDYYISDFDNEHLLDTYVFCLSEHDPDNTDGILYMWRGYGGNGRGAALVFDTSKLQPIDNSPFVLMQVNYGSSDERLGWFDKISSRLAEILSENHLADDKIYIASHAIFQRVKLFSLFTKHYGFQEEKEWRVVYMSDRARDGKLQAMQHYLNGPRGVEPKLKFKFEPIEGVTPSDFCLENILKIILIGPSASSVLEIRSVERMLELIGRAELKNRLIASSIPLRPT
jgi:hypothetical protein